MLCNKVSGILQVDEELSVRYLRKIIEYRKERTSEKRGEPGGGPDRSLFEDARRHRGALLKLPLEENKNNDQYPEEDEARDDSPV